MAVYKQVHKIKKELGCTGVTLVGDRGMIRTDQKAACTADNTQAHALTAMLALKVRRHLERAWRSLEVTVEEGLRQLEQLCVGDSSEFLALNLHWDSI